jgi:anti-anti-sigma factor
MNHMLAIHDAVQSACLTGTPHSPCTLRFTVVGELEASNVGRLAEQVLTALDQRDPAAIELDLARVSFLDAAAARELLLLYRRAADAGCVLLVSSAQPIVWWVFSVTGLAPIFPAPNGHRVQAEPGS